MTIKGTWEDVRAHDAELAGRQVWLVVLPEPAALAGQDDGKARSPGDEIRSYPGVPDDLIPIPHDAAVSMKEDLRTYLARWVAKYGTPRGRILSDIERIDAERRLAEFSVTGDHPMGVDNDQIDRELIEAYAHGFPGHQVSER